MKVGFHGIVSHPELIITYQCFRFCKARRLFEFNLLLTGFQMSDLKDIFATTEGSDNHTEEVTSLLDLIPDFHFSESLDVPSEDLAINYYVAGAIVRSVI